MPGDAALEKVLAAAGANAPDAARESLRGLLEGAPESFAADLAKTIAQSPDPQRAAVGLARYLESLRERGGDRGALWTDARKPRFLIAVLGQSQLLSDFLFRAPEWLDWLCTEAPLDRERTRDEMIAALPGIEGLGMDEACRRLRQFWRREMLRIGVRDFAGHAAIPSLVEDLALLADACIEAALACARADLAERLGTPRTQDCPDEEAAFVVMGMGKLGGLELNFSSDIDLLFLYSDDGATAGGQRSVGNAEYFQKLGERIIKVLSDPTSDGFLFRVDMRLRPFGSHAALAVSLDAAIEYYNTFGRAWERQALIKARPCAGDHALGALFLERMRPFVFPRYFDDATLEDIRETKAQLEAKIARMGRSDTEVKLGRGGIRDIEFTVQMLQLLNGGRIEALRVRNTLEAIRLLGERNLLSPFEATTLASNYSFLRRLEHRLQIEGGQQVHALPAGERAMDLLGRRLGYEDGAALRRAFLDRTAENRAILERFLASKGAGNLWVGDLLNPGSDGNAGREELGNRGFKEPDAARERLLRMAAGEPGRPHSLHVRQRFAEIAPELIRALAATPDPDTTLARLESVLAPVRAPAAIYEGLKYNPALCTDLVALVANSEYLSGIVMRDPGLFDVIGNSSALAAVATRADLEEELRQLQAAYDAEAALYRLRDGEMLRIGMRDLAQGNTVAQVGDQLTLLAEVILEQTHREALARAAKRFGPAPAGFAVLGLGKLGGWEMGYGSDVDLIFVYDAAAAQAAGIAADEHYGAAAAAMIRRLKEPTRHGTLYDVDARLRPDGSRGPLAVGDRRLASYFAEEAQGWERLALMKVRAVAGAPEFGSRVEARMKDIAFAPLTRAELEHIEEIRGRLVARAAPLDLKKDAGGIGAIEFAVRFWQMRHAAAHPELKRGDVFAALDILGARQLVDPEAADTLRAAYTALRRVLNRIRMMHGGDATELPASAEARDELARRLHIDGDLAAHVEGHKRKVREVYAAVYAETLEAAPETRNDFKG